MPVWLSINQSILAIYQSIYLSACLAIYQSINLSICPSVCLSIYLSILPSGYLFIYLFINVVRICSPVGLYLHTRARARASGTESLEHQLQNAHDRICMEEALHFCVSLYIPELLFI
jgi:hypothetical protein